MKKSGKKWQKMGQKNTKNDKKSNYEGKKF